MNSTKTRFSKVVDFNRVVLGIAPRAMNLQNPAEAGLSFTQLQEEAVEFKEAVEEADYIGCIDAVIDSLYFSYGIFYKLGLNEYDVDKLFAVVHDANMRKVAGVKKGREGFDALDADKPSNWVDPKEQMKEILNAKLNEVDCTRRA